MKQSRHHQPYVVVYHEPNYGTLFQTDTRHRRSRTYRRALRAAQRGQHDEMQRLLDGRHLVRA